MVDLRSLEVFYWVVKLGGFGRAAERLHMTQPAVSARISQIEARFGVRLLDRSTNRVPTPTPKGIEVFAHAERMLALHAELTASLSATAMQSGIVRIGTAETMVHTLLGRFIQRLHQAHPGITPEVTIDISPNLQTLLLGGEIDLALLLGPITDPRVHNTPLGEQRLVWVASPSLPLGDGPIALAALGRWPILSYPRGTLPHAQLAALFCRPDLPAVRIFASGSLSAIVRMAVDGIGIGVVPQAVAATELAAGRLRLLDVTRGLPSLRFTASFLATPVAGLAALVAGVAGEVAAEIADSS
jgi:DNA-binding transcriptional LysR family regulator